MSASPWEVIHDGAGDHVRRVAVTGGWLYQVEMISESRRLEEPTVTHVGWSAPVFVPLSPDWQRSTS